MLTQLKSIRFLIVLLACLVLGFPASLRAQEPETKPAEGMAESTESTPTDPTAPRSSVKILLVGNSFSRDATVYLPGLAAAGGKKLISLNVYKGSCALEEQAQAAKASETAPESPQARIFTAEGSANVPPGLPENFNLKEALQFQKWDYVTIQQFSWLSFQPETYEPHAHVVVDTIRKYAPQAEILVHETWAWREDDPFFGDKKYRNGTFTSQQMYDELKAAYTKLASTYHLRIIPVGDAFQAAKQTKHWHYVIDPNYDFANPKPGTLPNQDGSLNGGYYWGGPADKPTLSLDAHHASYAGRYLGACVMYEMLYNDSVENVSYCPKELKPEQAKELRHIAHETVEAHKKGETKSEPTETKSELAPATDPSAK